MKIWIVVADERESLFYDAGGPNGPSGAGGPSGAAGADGPFRLVLKITNPQAGPDGELETRRSAGAIISSTVQRHGIDAERSSRRTDPEDFRRSDREDFRRADQEDFAKRIADEIDRARQAGSFDRLVLGAGPPMLGLIRTNLSAPSRAVLAAEVAKDLVRFDERTLVEHLPPDTLPKPVPRPRAD